MIHSPEEPSIMKLTINCSVNLNLACSLRKKTSGVISEILWCFLSSELQKFFLINLPVFYTKLVVKYQDTVKCLVDLKRKPGELFTVSSKFVPLECIFSFPEGILGEFLEWEFKTIRQQWCFCCSFYMLFQEPEDQLGIGVTHPFPACVFLREVALTFIHCCVLHQDVFADAVLLSINQPSLK